MPGVTHYYFLPFLVVEQVISGLDQALTTMTKGEQSIVTIHPEYGYGSIEVKRDSSIIPPNSVIIYEVEMLDFVKVITRVKWLNSR